MFANNTHARLKDEALKTITSNIMIADVDLNIRYMNESVSALLKEAEHDLKKELPRFDYDKLVGSNIDIFHKNPAYQRGMLAALKTQHRATIWVGDRAFDLIVTPLSEKGKVKGFVVEWANAKERLQNLDYQAQMKALSRSQGTAEYSTDGTIVTANENFLRAVGYRIEELKGRPHSMLVSESHARSEEYRAFWAAL